MAGEGEGGWREGRTGETHIKERDMPRRWAENKLGLKANPESERENQK